jgi:hypothetical protein
MAHAIQRPGATHDRDGLCHRSIAVIVPGIKARRQRLTLDNATPFYGMEVPQGSIAAYKHQAPDMR